MKAFFSVFLFFSGLFTAFAQKDYYVYIQSDNRQPFYVILNGKTYSSSESGHVILSNLKAQTCQFAVGFPKNAFPEQHFALNIDKDYGYQLKNFNEKGWGLFNLQTLEIAMNRSNDNGSVIANNTGVKKTDSFTALLSNVVNDSSLLYKNNTPATTPAKQNVQAAVTTTTATVPAVVPVTTVATSAVANESQVAATIAKEQVAPVAKVATTVADTVAGVQNKVIEEKKSLSIVKKINEASSDFEINSTYTDRSENGTDTIRISIPLEPKTVTLIDEPKTKVTEGAKTVVVAETPRPVVEEAPKAVVEQKATPAKVVETTPVGPTQLQVNNSDCKKMATDADVDQLRVKLLDIQNLDDKIATTKKVLKSKCFTVKQVKAISELFSNDEGRYRLVETAYPFTLDTYNYSSLQELFSSDYYLNLFKGMLKK